MDLKNKVCTINNLTERLIDLPRPLVMTNGVFDILHYGHVDYLHKAATLGSSLIVALNSDSSVKKLNKGQNRPINNENDRAYVLAGLASIDLITFFNSKTPEELLQIVRPEIYVKGGDYEMKLLNETKLVESWGGKSLAIPFISGFSTTTIINQIKNS